MKTSKKSATSTKVKAEAAKAMSANDMMRVLREIEPGTPIVVIYSKSGPSTAASEIEAARSLAMGIPPNVYFGRFLEMFAAKNGQVCARVHVFNRGVAGELRTFNPSTGSLLAVMPHNQFMAMGAAFSQLAATMPRAA